MKRLLSLIIAFALLLSTFVPYCFADYSSQLRSFWDVALYKFSQLGDALSVDVGGFSLNLGPVSGNSPFNSWLSSNICGVSSDHLHHADSIQPGSYHTNSDGKGCAVCTCKYCGQDFLYRSDDLQQDYQTYLHDNGLDNNDPIPVPSGSSYSGHWRSNCPYIVKPSHAGSILMTLPSYSRSFQKSDSSTYFFAPTYFPSDSFHYGPVIISDYSQPINISVTSLPSLTLSFSESVSEYLYDGLYSFYVSTPYHVSGGGITNAYTSTLTLSSHDVSVFAHDLIQEYYVFDSYDDSSFIPSTITVNDTDYNVTSINFYTRTVITEGDTKIEYGDNVIKIYEGDTVVQTINYIIENDDPGTDPGNGDDSSTSHGGGTVDPGDASGSGGSGCCEQCALLLRQVNSYLLQIQTLVDQINDKLGPESDNYMEGIYNLLVEINTALDNLPTEPHKDYEAKLTTISNQLANIWGDLDTIKTSLTAVETNTTTTNEKLDTVHSDLEAVLAELQEQKGILQQIKQHIPECYYCHPFTSSERGSNERQNRIIRRFLPKGKSLAGTTQGSCDQIAQYMNNMHRKILDYLTPDELFQQALAALI